ncbi:MAG: hypothetical protein LC667_17170 [Thioalkalivibrio sp.]|nr:hypothetical protein [Thioalkalivibrio sp.]
MATLEDIKARTRLELSDLKVPFYERFNGSGSSARFDIKGIQHIEGDVFVYPLGNPGSPLTEGTEFEVQRREGMLIFATPPTAGEIYIIEGEYSRFFSDEEIGIFTKTAFEMHTRGRGVNYTGLPSHEVLLVAILAQIEALWVLKASSAYDINIHAPEGMFVPRGQRFEQLNVFLQEVEQRYRDLSGALGVGLYAVEMFSLRRVSRTTGRYVPIFIDREYDDTRPPQRVYPSISPMGGEVADETVMQHTLQVYQGRPFEEEFYLELDGAVENFDPDEEFIARLLFSKHATYHYRDILPEFMVTVNANENTVKVALTKEDTAKLQSTGAYVWELAWVESEDDTVPLVQGTVLVESALPVKNVHVKMT